MVNYSKEQGLKIIFFQLGRKFYLPKEMIIYIYNHLVKLNEKDKIKTKNFRTSIIFDNLLIKERFCPLNRGIEWSIKNNFDEHRNMLMIQIKVIGEERYLYKENKGNILIANKKERIKYLNNGYKNEIIEDYENFLKYRDTIDESSYSLLIDEYYDTKFL